MVVVTIAGNVVVVARTTAGFPAMVVVVVATATGMPAIAIVVVGAIVATEFCPVAIVVTGA